MSSHSSEKKKKKKKKKTGCEALPGQASVFFFVFFCFFLFFLRGGMRVCVYMEILIFCESIDGLQSISLIDK